MKWKLSWISTLGLMLASLPNCKSSGSTPPIPADEVMCTVSDLKCDYYVCSDGFGNTAPSCTGNQYNQGTFTTDKNYCTNYCPGYGVATCARTCQTAAPYNGWCVGSHQSGAANAKTCFCQTNDPTCTSSSQKFLTGAAACQANQCPSTNTVAKPATDYPVLTNCTATSTDWKTALQQPPYSLTTGVDYLSPGKNNDCNTGAYLMQKQVRQPVAMAAKLSGAGTVVRQGSATVSVTWGKLSIDSFTPYCNESPGLPCFASLGDFTAVLADFNLDGHSVSGLTVSIPAPIDMGSVLTPDGVNFVFDLPANSHFGAYAKIDGSDQWLDLSNPSPIDGSYNLVQGTVGVQMTLQASVYGVITQLNLALGSTAVVNRAPQLGEPTFTGTIATGNTCSAQVTLSVPVSDPDGDTVSILWSYELGTLGSAASTVATLPVGTHSVQVAASDAKGGGDSATRNVTVTDGTPPQFASVPPDVTSTTCGGTINIGTATAVDNCDGTVAVSNDAPAKFSLGTTTVTWTAKDAAGNVATHIQKVTVAGPPKFVSLPNDVNITACDGHPSIGTATAVDICGSAVTVSNNAPLTFPIGTTTVTWKATDSLGDVATFQQKVTISAANDLGVEHYISTIKNNACIQVSKYPSWGSYMHAVVIQPQAGGIGWPVNFTYSNCGSNTRSGSLPGPWQQAVTQPVSASCPTFIKLGGAGTGSISLTWWGNG